MVAWILPHCPLWLRCCQENLALAWTWVSATLSLFPTVRHLLCNVMLCWNEALFLLSLEYSFLCCILTDTMEVKGQLASLSYLWPPLWILRGKEKIKETHRTVLLKSDFYLSIFPYHTRHKQWTQMHDSKHEAVRSKPFDSVQGSEVGN